ncbi:arginine decarboxylase [Limnochorda pilosa]|uniref:Arginine decarboxylase n=1 Tax=Limnochorda pilosa TaxID=1555112 RepID=A0A0K2SPE1_LIMPI|nr:arginine decarboxylase [Limnochorda pilosa]
MAALAHGAAYARFLVNGTTAGLHALFMAETGPGRSVILPRNVHRSVIGGLVLSGARPRFVAPEFLEEAGVSTVPTPAALREALEQEPGAVAVLLTAPTYYGWLPDVLEAAEVARRAGVPLWVDEAHGSLLGFHPRLPPGALASGADAAVRSLHKGGGSLVQASLLLTGPGGPEADRVDAALELLQSSSPSPLLLASLDAARAWLASGARPRLERLVEEAERLRQDLNRIPGVQCWGAEVVGQAGIAAYDPTRIVFSVAGLGLTGLQAAAWLRKEHRLQVEMADLVQVVVVLSAADGRTSVGRILDAVRRLAGEARQPSEPMRLPPPPLPPAVLTPREAFLAPARSVSAAEAEGEVAAEMVAPYPPGIPVLVPGERITRESLEHLRRLRRAGARIQGTADPTGATVRVVDGSAGSPGRRRRREGG